MTTFTTKSTLLAVATAALLSVGASAASAQEFTRPADDTGAYAMPAPNAVAPLARPGYSALAQGRSAVRRSPVEQTLPDNSWNSFYGSE